jgi:CysZ protein
MDTFLLSLQRAARDLLTARMLTLALWPMVLSLLAWGALAWWFGATWKSEIDLLLAGTPLADLADWLGADWLVAYAAVLLLVLLWLPAMYATAILITSVVLMPFIVDQVSRTYYPSLARGRGGSLLGSILNGFYALVLYLIAWIVLLPVWLLAPFGVMVSLSLNAWLNQRLFMYDALSEHANAVELKALRYRGGVGLFTLSALLGLLHFVPVFNLFAPVYMALTFTHYALSALEQLRSGQAA